MTDEVVVPPLKLAAVDPSLAAKVDELAARIAKTADADTKEFLGKILQASEHTITELKAMQIKLDAAEAAAAAAIAKTAGEAVAATETAARSALKAAAKAAGAVDAADVLPFIKLADVKVNDAGESNVGTLVDALKTSKPHLFAKVNTSAAAASPNAGDGQPKSVLGMTKEEYAAAKAAIVKR